MTLPRVLSWRSLRVAALSVVALVGLVVTGLALWGLPAPPALTIEQGPRVSWKWVWQGMRFVNPGAAPARLDGLPDRASHVVQSRLTERPYFVFSLDEGGSERYLHYRFDLDRGTYEALTAVAARSYVGGFDGEGRRVIYASTSGSPRSIRWARWARLRRRRRDRLLPSPADRKRGSRCS